MNKKTALSTDPILIHEGSIQFCSYKFYLIPGTEAAQTECSPTGIKFYIGIDTDQFSTVICSIIHEIEEIFLFLNGHRFHNTKLPPSYESINCVFMVNHDTLQLGHMILGEKLDILLPLAYDYWTKYNKEKMKGKKHGTR